MIIIILVMNPVHHSNINKRAHFYHDLVLRVFLK